MTARDLTFALALGIAGWFASPSRAEPPPPLVTANPIYEGTMPGVVGTAPVGPAEPVDAAVPGLTERDPFRAGSWTFQALVGSYRQAAIGPHGPAVDYAPIVFRAGYILNTPQREDCWRGCWEVLVEANYSPIVNCTGGSTIAGPDALLRYEFVQPSCVIVPYVQCGAGFILNDAWKTSYGGSPSLLGESFEFLLRAEVGARYMISDHISLDVEAGLQHISSLGLSRHDGGVNNLGGSIGLTYFYGPH